MEQEMQKTVKYSPTHFSFWNKKCKFIIKKVRNTFPVSHHTRTPSTFKPSQQVEGTIGRAHLATKVDISHISTLLATHAHAPSPRPLSAHQFSTQWIHLFHFSPHDNENILHHTSPIPFVHQYVNKIMWVCKHTFKFQFCEQLNYFYILDGNSLYTWIQNNKKHDK